MWIVFALLSALFSGLTAVLAKVGIKNTDSHLATALRTVVVLVFAWLMVFVVGSQSTLGSISGKSLLFLILSGFATGASWLCYFRALATGDINKVVPIDKSSVVLTMLLAIIFLGESFSVLKGAAMVLILSGTLLMVELKSGTDSKAAGKSSSQKSYIVYAVLSAIFASLTSILAKVGIQNVESNLGTAIRTCVVLVMAWLMVFVTGKQKEIKDIDKKSWLFIALSGLATGLSWLFFYRALQDGPASVVLPIDKLSILITVGFSCLVFKEKLSKRGLAGLLLIVCGTLLLLIK
ncbi:MAG: EamA family transporter [Oscillospiraceae bacterium]